MSLPSIHRTEYPRELLLNQLWQSANFLAKALFLALLTPWMLHVWGPEQYGLFALSSSLLVSLALLDGGVRNMTRVRLAPLLADGRTIEAKHVLAHSLLTFFFVCALALGVALALCRNGFLEELLHLPAGGQRMLLISGALTALWMGSVLALEPLAALGKLSEIKAANTQGILLALPACSGILALGFGPMAVMGTMIRSLLAPNILLLVRHKFYRGGIAFPPWTHAPQAVHETLQRGFPYYLTTISLIAKTHGLTFWVSAVAGPAEAGLFYILLRLSEMLSNVGSTSSETSVATLASVPDAERLAIFHQAWRLVGLLCLHGALALALLGPVLWKWWLPNFCALPPWIWPTLALFGLAGAWSQMAMNSSMGVDRVKSAAATGLAEATLTLCGAIWGYKIAGFTGLFCGGTLASLATMWQSRRICQTLHKSLCGLWLAPLASLIPGLCLSAVFFLLARISHSHWICLLSLLVPALAIGSRLRQLALSRNVT
ncbi:MAG: hypothetical protein NTZ01_00925 [Verrucomicrobia bacterium]|nr:hypothetical protein [Verrucomicrobiota bacterium]